MQSIFGSLFQFYPIFLLRFSFASLDLEYLESPRVKRIYHDHHSTYFFSFQRSKIKQILIDYYLDQLPPSINSMILVISIEIMYFIHSRNSHIGKWSILMQIDWRGHSRLLLQICLQISSQFFVRSDDMIAIWASMQHIFPIAHAERNVKAAKQTGAKKAKKAQSTNSEALKSTNAFLSPSEDFFIAVRASCP